MKEIPIELTMEIEQLALNLSDNEKIIEMFKKCFFNTLKTTTELSEAETPFVFTGDIPAMWLRDSTAQVRHYLPFCIKYEELSKIVEGLIKRQLMYINIDGYANAFNKNPGSQGHTKDHTEQSPWVWERKYEIDSLCYPVQLIYLHWKMNKATHIFDEELKKTMNRIIDIWKIEQRHENSSYYFERANCVASDTLRNEGRSMPVNYTGMTWSGFRPSDDACKFGYLIPANMFAVVVLGYIMEFAVDVYQDEELAKKAAALRDDIEYGIITYGIYEHPVYGKIYAYETDGFGNYNLMDDANVPSLLSIPYFRYRSREDEIYKNTRKFILSGDNPYYYKGKYAKGIGSPHTPVGNIWPIALIMQALTSSDGYEIDELINILTSTDDDTGLMHESFNPNKPGDYTREWFAWANSLFAELLYEVLKDRE
jgi:uncharacterized protein